MSWRSTNLCPFTCPDIDQTARNAKYAVQSADPEDLKSTALTWIEDIRSVSQDKRSELREAWEADHDDQTEEIERLENLNSDLDKQLRNAEDDLKDCHAKIKQLEEDIEYLNNLSA